MLPEAMEEIAAQEDLEWDFGKLPEPEQPAPPGVQAPAVVLQETAPTKGEQMEGDSEAAPPRDAWGTTLVLDFARLRVSTPERREVTTPPVPLPVLPPVQEQAAPAEVEMAVEEAEETAMEEPEEDVLGDTQVMIGKDEKDLMAGE